MASLSMPTFDSYRLSVIGLLLVAVTGGRLAAGADTGAVVFVTMVSHFDRPWAMEKADLAAFQQLSDNHPQMRWTHLYNPVAYTQDTPLRDEMEHFVKRSRDVHGAEIGVHLHMYESLLQAAGVRFLTHPSLNAKAIEGSSDATGYSVPITRYSRKEIGRMLQLTHATYARRGLGKPKTFCAGFYATNLDLQLEIAEHGYTTSAAAFPPSAEIGAQYAPTWQKLAGWQESVTFESPPYRISQRSILPTGSPPYIAAADGQPLVELPQTCKIDWMVSADDMKTIFRRHLAIARGGQSTAVCLAIHESSGKRYFAKFDEVLTSIDQRIQSQTSPPIRYMTASELRDEFLARWQ